jgi:hypothetical protein
MALDAEDIARILGRIEQQNSDAGKSREIMRQEWRDMNRKFEKTQQQQSDILHAVNDLRQGHVFLKTKIDDEVMTHVNDYKDTKNKGIGAWKALTIVAGISGAAAALIVASFKDIFAFFKG